MPLSQKQLELQPLLLKGHCLELEQALKQALFEPYVSKTTGARYDGGKVERELEEIAETCDDYFELAQGRMVAARAD